MADQTQRDIELRVTSLRAIFSKNNAYRQFERTFDDLLRRRRVEIETGARSEARCIALIGASGSGKTTAVRNLFDNHTELIVDAETDQVDVVSLSVPTPATLKFVGLTTLSALGFPLRRERTAQIIWDMVKGHLQERRTLFLHYDEAQDLALHQTPREMKSVVNTLKSLLQHQAWPVGLILTGTPELKTIINHDPQLARRVYPIEFPQLNAALDAGKVIDLLGHYAGAAGLKQSADVITTEHAARLIHAADQEFGLMIEMTIAALEGALKAGRETIEVSDFAHMFRGRSGCIDGLNPFIAKDFERIEPRKLFNDREIF